MTISAFLAEDFPALLDLLYSAALDSDQWPKFLQGLMKPFDGASGVLHFYDVETQTTPTAPTFGLANEYLLTYQQHFCSRNPYPIQCFARLPLLEVNPATAVLSKAEVSKTEFYNDWMKPQGMSPEHLGCMLHKDEREMVVLAIAPDAKSLERSSDRYVKQFEVLATHLQRAIALSKHSQREPARNGLTAQFSCGAMVISQSRAVKAVNPPAQSLLREALLLAVDPLGRLRIKDPDCHAAFVTAVESVLVRQAPVGGPVHCRASPNGHRASIIVLKLPGSDGTLALVLVVAGNNNAHSLPPQFTAAEARLARAPLDGQSLSEFAAQAGVSITTARKQLAALFAKTGTNRQAALVAWLLQRNT